MNTDTFWRALLQTVAKNPISTFAVFLVAVSFAFLGYMAVWQTSILTSPDWCRRALGAEKATPGTTSEQATEAVETCNEMLLVQLNAIAWDSHIDHGTIALLLIVLVVVVVAGARASWKLSKDGFEGSVSKHDAAEAADHVVAGAKEAAAEVKADAVPPSHPPPPPPGPGWPQ